MLALLHDGAFLTFCTAVCTGAWGFMKVYFMYKMKLVTHQATKASEVENLRRDVGLQIADELNKVVATINPILESHSKLLEQLQTTVSNMAVIYANTAEMQDSLKAQFEGFKVGTSNVTQGAGLVMAKIKGLETEVINLKNDMILVRTKK